MSASLCGQTIVVTGAGSGIGLGVLKAAQAAGATVVGIDYTEAAKEVIAGQGACAVSADVREPDALRAAIHEARDRTGRLDGVVNNAGLTLTAPFLEADVEMWDQLWLTNQRSVLIGCQTAAQIMVKDRTRGSLVNIASVHATASDHTYEAYAGTKGAIRAMGQSMAWSLGPHGIRVNTLSPGLTLTEAVAKAAKDPALDALFQSWHADATVPKVEELAQVAVFLLSDQSVVLNGTEIVADKGTVARLCNVGG